MMLRNNQSISHIKIDHMLTMMEVESQKNEKLNMIAMVWKMNMIAIKVQNIVKTIAILDLGTFEIFLVYLWLVFKSLA